MLGMSVAEAFQMRKDEFMDNALRKILDDPNMPDENFVEFIMTDVRKARLEWKEQEPQVIKELIDRRYGCA